MTDNNTASNNIEKNLNYGILQTLSNKSNHNISRIKINDKFTSNIESQSFTRVYYFIKGTGYITINNIKHIINPGNCFYIEENSTEILFPNNELDFIRVCDKF